MDGPRPKICIVAPSAYPLFVPEIRSPFGGSEVRAAMLARGLARRGALDVAFVVYDHGQPQPERREGMTFWKREGETAQIASGPAAPHAWWHRSKLPLYRRGTLPQRLLWLGLKPTHVLGRPLRTALRRARGRGAAAGWVREFAIARRWVELYDRIDADVYLAAPGGTHLSTELAWYGLHRGKRFVYLAASDADFDRAYVDAPDETGPLGMPGFMHAYALENAHAHVVQSEAQAAMLEQRFDRKARLVLRNPIDLTTSAAGATRERILWVGKSSDAKRPEAMLELARRVPELRFTVVMNEAETSRHRECLAVARTLPNVELLEYVPFPEMDRLFAESRLLVNTSRFEGVPNAFLQAAKHSVPIVSLSVDPDGMLSRDGAGIACGDDLVALASAVRRLASSAEERADVGRRGRAYVERHHHESAVVASLEALLLEEAGKTAARGRTR